MATVLRQGTWMDDEIFEKTCIREKGKRRSIHQPFHGTLITDFMLRQEAGKFMLGKYFRPKKSMEVKKMFGDGCCRNYAHSQSLEKMGKTQSEGWRLRMIARKARGTSTHDHGWRKKYVVTSIAQAAKG